jgi:hypothetical protein
LTHQKGVADILRQKLARKLERREQNWAVAALPQSRTNRVPALPPSNQIEATLFD